MNKNIFTWMVLASLLFYACSRRPYASTNKIYKNQARELAGVLKESPLKDSFATAGFVGTTNFNLRKPNYVIIHHTAQNSCDQTLKTFTLTRTQVSAHYVICKDGTIYHMLNDYLRAWHGGISKWGNTSDINSSSIGIEIDNNGFDTFSKEQIASLELLLGHLKRGFGIPAANFIGHADIAPSRKNDPNIHFPWQQLAESGFGLWWDDTTHVEVPVDFNALQALRIIGYNIKDSAAAIKAFKRKYIKSEGEELTEADRKVLFKLFKKYE